MKMNIFKNSLIFSNKDDSRLFKPIGNPAEIAPEFLIETQKLLSTQANPEIHLESKESPLIM